MIANWFSLALLSAAIFGWVTIIDKLMVEQNFTDPFMYSLFIRVYGVVAGIIFVVSSGGWQSLPFWAILAAFMSGVLQIASGGIYFLALTRADASLVAATEQSRPLLTLLWGVWFLGELLAPASYLGVGLIVVGTLVLSLERDHLNRKTFRFNRTVLLLILGSVFYTLAALVLKLSLREANGPNSVFWDHTGALLAASLVIVVWPTGRKRLWRMLKGASLKSYLGSIGNEGLANVAGLTLTQAYKLGPLAPVTALYTTQPLFIMVFAWFAYKLRPSLFKAESSGTTIIPRWLIILLIMAGIYFLSN